MGTLTPAQLRRFDEEGYLVVRGLLDPRRDLDPVIAEYEGVLDRLAAELHAAGRLPSTYADLPFGARLIRVCADSGQVHSQYFDFSLPQAGIRPDTPFWAGPAVFATLCNERLLDAVESVLGPEIYSNPVQHVRLKPPERLTPRNPETGLVQLGANGCLQVFPRSHRRGLLHHCRRPGGLTIAQAALPEVEAVPLPMARGDVLFMTRLTCHSSLSNHSDEVRWSFDLRYNPIGQPTGRGAFPGFVARSRTHPERQLRDPAAWERLWRDTRDRLAQEQDRPFNRWQVDDAVCA